MSLINQAIRPMLYKFFSCPNAEDVTSRFQQILDNNELWIADPTTFNDPFECKVVLDLAAAEETRRARYFRDNPNANDAEFTRWNDGLDDSKWYVENSVREGILRSHGITCFTRDWKNELFWAHYGRSHTGFCVGFDEQKLRQWPEVAGAGNVSYLQQAPVFRFFHDDPSEFAAKVMFSKSAYWAYEEEFRLVFHSTGLKKLPEGAIVEITLGCRAPAMLRAEARKRLANSAVKRYQAGEVLADYKLDRTIIEANIFTMTSHF
jgi:hypothetical protein